MIMKKPGSTSQVAPEDRVSLKQKIAYAAGGVAEGIQDRFDNGVMNPVFVVGAGMSPVVMSTAGAFYRLYDAFTDLIMGSVSDNARTRWGRRRPFVFGGAILMGLSMPWLFWFNPDWPILAIGVWMVIFNLLILTTQTIFNVPYQSLLIECTPDTNERTNVVAWRAFVGMGVGLTVSWSWRLSQLPVFYVDGEPDVLNGIRWLVMIAAVPVMLLGILPAIFMEERFYKEAKTQKKVSLKENFKATGANFPFKLMLAFVFVFVGGGGLHWGLVFYVKLFYVCQGDQVLASQLAGLQGSAQAILGVLGIPAARYLALKIGKMKSIVVAMVFSLAAYLSTYVLMTPDYPYLSMVPFILLGPVTSVIWVVLPSMLGDVVDYDELNSHKRMEGAYSAVFGWVLKLARTVSAILSGPLVVWAGYEASKRHELAQNMEVLNTMRLLMATLPTVFMSIAALILWFYPLTAERVKLNRMELERRRGKM